MEPQERKIPISLGKPSLRQRLEAYYSLIAPDLLADQAEWRSKFDQIYNKFGGTHEKERLLSVKLAKKYGTTVRLRLVESVTANAPMSALSDGEMKHDEEWYNLTVQEKGSKIIDFTSNRYDPVATLAASESSVAQVNPWLPTCSLLDHIDQFRTRLPSCDPLGRTLVVNQKRNRASTKTPAESNKRPRTLSAFASLAEPLEKGPLSVLHSAFLQRERVRVVIRYVNGIRGTLTGYLLAFDKHMNMILRDVDEVYSPRSTTESSTAANVEREFERRLVAIQGGSNHGTWCLRQRHMKQIMVRGDNVVLVYKAENERSAWPRTSKSPASSIYQRSNPESENRVGTPGCLLYAYQRHQRRKGG